MFSSQSRYIHTLFGHVEPVTSVVFSPDGATLISGGNNIILWSLITRKPIRVLSGHLGNPNDKTVKLFFLNDRETITLTGHSSSVSSIAFSPDGRTLASGSSDKTIKLWEIS